MINCRLKNIVPGCIVHFNCGLQGQVFFTASTGVNVTPDVIMLVVASQRPGRDVLVLLPNMQLGSVPRSHLDLL